MTSNPTPPDPEHPWGGQRSEEILLTGDTAAKVEAAAKAKVPNGTIVRVETDADGGVSPPAQLATTASAIPGSSIPSPTENGASAARISSITASCSSSEAAPSALANAPPVSLATST